MSHVSNDRPTDLKINPLADFIAEQARADEKTSRLHAFSVKLEEGHIVEKLYALVDPLASTYGVFRIIVNICNATNNLDIVHMWLMSTGGLIATVAIGLFLVSTSLIASFYDKKKNNPEIIQLVVDATPSIREFTKGKNAYKGTQSSILALSVLGCHLNYLLTPLGLVFALFTSFNRVILNRMREKRKGLMKKNIALHDEIAGLSALTAEQRKSFEDRLKKNEQTKKVRALSFLQVALNGFFDGQYLYVGPLSVAIFSPELMIPMMALGVFFTISCIIARIYEEYDLQQQLVLTQTQTKLQILRVQLSGMHQKICMQALEDQGECATEEQLKALIQEFEATRALVLKQSRHSWSSAFLAGLKDGLTAYSAMNSIVFTVVTICLMSGTPVPPLFIATSLVIGALLLISCLSFTLWQKHLESKNYPTEISFEEHRQKVREQIRQNRFNSEIFIENVAFQQTLDIRMLSTKLPPRKISLELYEMIRSWFAGLGKGKNFISLSCNSLQEPNEQGHFQDTPVMWGLSAGFAVIVSTIFCLNAQRKGLGKEPLAIRNPLPKSGKQQSTDDKSNAVEMTTLSSTPAGMSVVIPITSGVKQKAAVEEELEEKQTTGELEYKAPKPPSIPAIQPLTLSRSESEPNIQIPPQSSPSNLTPEITPPSSPSLLEKKSLVGSTEPQPSPPSLLSTLWGPPDENYKPGFPSPISRKQNMTPLGNNQSNSSRRSSLSAQTPRGVSFFKTPPGFNLVPVAIDNAAPQAQVAAQVNFA